LKDKNLADQLWLTRTCYFLNLSESFHLKDFKNHPAFCQATLERYVDDCKFFLDVATLIDNPVQAAGNNPIIFEGAQGLMLDEEYSYDFIHSTPPNCGMKNVRILADDYGIDKVQAIYVTRSYLTRHGNRKLPGECDLGLKGTDKTNVDHPIKVAYAMQNLIQSLWLQKLILNATLDQMTQ